jgi:hypothetical protein
VELPCSDLWHPHPTWSLQPVMLDDTCDAADCSHASVVRVARSIATECGRARLLKKNFNMTPANLIRFIYHMSPEIVALRPNEAILV